MLHQLENFPSIYLLKHVALNMQVYIEGFGFDGREQGFVVIVVPFAILLRVLPTSSFRRPYCKTFEVLYTIL